MTLNYQMIVERYLKPNGVLGGSIPGSEIFSLATWHYSSHVATVPKKNYERNIL